jgi:NADH-quinone oxidoreductase subunit M
MVILSAFKANFWIAFVAATTLIVGAGYTLWMVKRVIFGEITNDKVAALQDINSREFLILSTLAVAVLFFGLYPAPLLEVMDATVRHLIEHIAVSKVPLGAM